MTKVRIVLAVLALVFAMSFTGVMAQDQTIVEIAAGNEDFSTLVSLVEAAGLVETLSGEGPFTVFAPTNAAFEELPAAAVDFLLANPEALTRVLTYHVLAGEVMSADVSTMMAATVEGSELTVVADDMGITIDGAQVVAADIDASNGVIHVINHVLVPPVELMAVDPLSVSDNIIAAGSSTVFPLTERMADLFNQDGFSGTITVDSIGTGAGFERFCVNAETDISNASRPIRDTEVEACAGNGLDAIGFFVAVDALAITVSQENDFLTGLTLEQLAAVFSGTAATWADVDPAYPAEPILLFSPGSDSGTYDYFVEEVFDEDETPIQGASNIQFSEDDNVLVQGVEGSPFAIGYFGYAYFQENQDKLKAIAIEGVIPSEATGASGAYPLSRPLFIYSAASVLQAKPQVAAFVNYYLQNANAQLGAGSDQIGYIPTPIYVQRLNAFLLAVATGM
jgi:phosphate transport system substrate-binding protein